MIAAKCFDLINSFSIDYMHAILLGVVRKLTDLWLDSKNHGEAFYIPKKKQIILDKRITAIKPPSEITRKPRSIFQRSDYKANEIRSLLLYYLRFSLDDLLPKKYITHFQLLSSAIYILLKESISPNEIDLAEKKLVEFANKFEELYHAKNVTMNVHLLRHIANSVRYLGPLWSQSTFGFETSNGVLVHSRTAKRDFLQQISWVYCMNATLDKDIKINDPFLSLGEKKKISFDTQDLTILNEHGIITTSLTFDVYFDISIRGTKFKSTKSKQTSSIDYFVRFLSDKIGAIKYYFSFEQEVYALCEMYTVINLENHLEEVEASNVKKVINVKDIKHKLIYLKIAKHEIISRIPNRFEKT